jgi:hypothetical protein
MVLASLFLAFVAQAPAVVPLAEDPAQAAFERLCAASGPAARAPITAFRLVAEARTRSGVQTNDLEIDYRYLAPDCIRFMLPSKNETGRFGPDEKQYWLKSGQETVVLAGREYKEDRRQVDDMLALAKNYIALSNPAALKLEGLELLAVAPADLGEANAKKTKKLAWLALESPDFALVRREGLTPKGTYRVELGLDQHSLPAAVVIRAKSDAAVAPLFVYLSAYQEKDGFRLPMQLHVHVKDGAAFADQASQEVYVKTAELRPKFTAADFKP